MVKVLLTGGSGFIATHVLKVLLERGYDVVFTVRSPAKGERIIKAHDTLSNDRLSYVIVEDIGKPGAYDQAVVSEPPVDAVIHTASPFHDNFDNPKDILDPAINGTRGLLSAIKAYAPTVRRIVLTSSFAAMINTETNPRVYDESSWNPVTLQEAMADRSKAYRGSKTLAEKAAWEFIDSQSPNFDLVTLCPPLVYGPVMQHLSSLDSLNTSNHRIRDFVQGRFRDKMPPVAGSYLWTDVRDLALAHVRAVEVPEAGGHRFFITAGHCSSKMLVDAIRTTHPELALKLPPSDSDDLPADVYGYDNSKAKRVLGITFRSLEESIGDTVTSLVRLGA